MIDDPLPSDWRDLQLGVAQILSEVGLAVEEPKLLETPRGTVEVDVYGIDPGSVDQISYIVECKNWSRPIDQSVIHAFTTVMHETGAHIGYVISKHGLQNGAEKYLHKTNIKGFTYADFQLQYLPVWMERHFMPGLRKATDALISYTEPFNSHRERYVVGLSGTARDKFIECQEEYDDLGFAMLYMTDKRFLLQRAFGLGSPMTDLELLKQITEKALPVALPKFSAGTFRELKDELLTMAIRATEEFNTIFGKNIFA